MDAKHIVSQILNNKLFEPKTYGSAFAPVNFALIKYWGKRNAALNLPMTSSLSIALPEKGAFTKVKLIDASQDEVIFNQKILPYEHSFTQRIVNFLNLFRVNHHYRFRVETEMNLPAASGLATSACGFAALTLAMNDLFNWQLKSRELSILARLGSGSACRSLWQGFVEWHAGTRDDGMDSYAEPLDMTWDSLCMGLLILHPEKKKISSREAMQKTVESSCYYKEWPTKVAHDLPALKQAIIAKDFETFGRICESNALAMHASMLTAWPPIFYWTPKSLEAIQKIWQLREEGLPIYFTQDAGANLKLLFLNADLQRVQSEFETLELVWPFTSASIENHVVLVDEKDRTLGTAEKLVAHQNALCHRAFSVFIFRQNHQQLELLIQQRQHDKYHCGGLWTNTCCSHPKPGESLLAAAKRRLKEELNVEIPLFYQGNFHYIASFDNQLTENEVDHVFVGYGEPAQLLANTKEIADLRWIGIDELQKALAETPNLYTPWFKQALDLALAHVALGDITGLQNAR